METYLLDEECVSGKDEEHYDAETKGNEVVGWRVEKKKNTDFGVND